MNIKNVLEKLNNNKISDYKISEAVGVSQPTIQRIRSGTTKNPPYNVGVKIIEFAKQSGLTLEELSQ